MRYLARFVDLSNISVEVFINICNIEATIILGNGIANAIQMSSSTISATVEFYIYIYIL